MALSCCNATVPLLEIILRLHCDHDTQYDVPLGPGAALLTGGVPTDRNPHLALVVRVHSCRLPGSLTVLWRWRPYSSWITWPDSKLFRMLLSHQVQNLWFVALWLSPCISSLNGRFLGPLLFSTNIPSGLCITESLYPYICLVWGLIPPVGPPWGFISLLWTVGRPSQELWSRLLGLIKPQLEPWQPCPVVSRSRATQRLFFVVGTSTSTQTPKHLSSRWFGGTLSIKVIIKVHKLCEIHD